MVLGLVGLVTACSSGDSDPDGDASATPGTSAGVETTVPEVDPSPPAEPSGDETAPIVPFSVSIDVAVESVATEGALAVELDPAELGNVDPFTRFSSCSGLRASVGTYVVTAVDVEAEVQSVSVLTTDRVAGPGIHDADVRVELAGADAITAAGTVTLDEGLRSGTFQAFEPTGARVAGSFRCDGPDGVAMPIADAAVDDDVLDAVEVVALLRRGDAERVVGLTLDTAEVTSADARCPGVTGSDESVVVSVEGDQAIGAINVFELTPDPGPRW